MITWHSGSYGLWGKETDNNLKFEQSRLRTNGGALKWAFIWLTSEAT